MNHNILSIAAAPAGMVVSYAANGETVTKPVVCLALVAVYDTYCEVDRRALPMVLSDGAEKIVPVFNGQIAFQA